MVSSYYYYPTVSEYIENVPYYTRSPRGDYLIPVLGELFYNISLT